MSAASPEELAKSNGAPSGAPADPRTRFTESPFGRSKRRSEAVARWAFFGMSASMILPLLALVAYLVHHALPSLSLGFLLDPPVHGMREGGIWPALIGTFYLVFVALAVSAPVGVLAAIYMNEYARDNWFHRMINSAVINLAGVPSIVHALFGVGAFVIAAGFGESVLAASLTLAIMTMPVVITSTREALASVPRSFREACWNVGATRWQTIRAVVLPNSVGGILTGVILEVSRTAGETAPIMLTGAAAYMAVERGDLLPYTLGSKCMALSMHLFVITTQIPGVPESSLAATAVVLMGTVLFINVTSIALRMVLRSRKRW